MCTVHITTQPETTHTNHLLQTGVSALHSAARISPSSKSLFAKTLPLTLLDVRLCEPNKGYLGHNFHVPNTLKNQVQKNSRGYRRACLAKCSWMTATMRIGEQPKLDTMIRSYPAEAT
jgi:hypothetical protein